MHLHEKVPWKCDFRELYHIDISVAMTWGKPVTAPHLAIHSIVLGHQDEEMRRPVSIHHDVVTLGRAQLCALAILPTRGDSSEVTKGANTSVCPLDRKCK